MSVRTARPGQDQRRSTRRTLAWGFAFVVVAALALSVYAGLSGAPAAGMPAAPRGAAAPAVQPLGHSKGWPAHDCDGMYWASSYWANYSPAWCYGHDEPTVSYISTAPGSGGDANFQIVLPADSSSYAQGDFYATFWFGGTVYDTNSTGGNDQAFLEIQFYPAAPYYTGSGSGTKDCLPDGSFNYAFSAGSNKWFACGIVWQLQYIGSYLYENAAIAEPLDVKGTTGIMTLHSNDHVYVNYSGVAQSATTPWNISITDTTAATTGLLSLKNGSLVISPYYSTAAPGHTLSWGASNPGAIAFAYEIGHAFNVSAFYCAPGDGVCGSYWPGRWLASGQVALSLPTLGAPGSAAWPSRMVFSSSQGGEREVNGTACGHPSTSTKTNCMYPWYQYRSATQTFDFGTSPASNDTHDYGGQYQFPSGVNSIGQFVGNSQHAPWGTVRFAIFPGNATATFGRAGVATPLSLPSNRTLYADYLETQYWLNVTAPGCGHLSRPVYVPSGGVLSEAVFLACQGHGFSASIVAHPASGTAPLSTSFTASITGGTSPFTYYWSLGDGTTSTAAHPSDSYPFVGTYPISLIVGDANGNGTIAYANVSALTPACGGKTLNASVGEVFQCHLNATQQVVFRFTISMQQWYSTGYANLFEVDGTVSGTQPVYKMGSGMGGTPSLGSAKQRAGGPNAHLKISLQKAVANRYGGWGNYWVVIRAVGGSGGFCFAYTFQNDNTPPGCSSAVMAPHHSALPTLGVLSASHAPSVAPRAAPALGVGSVEPVGTPPAAPTRMVRGDRFG